MDRVTPPDLLAALVEKRWREALRLAAAFQHLGKQKTAITSVWQACTRPDFYRSLGQDPQALIEAGVKALKERYG